MLPTILNLYKWAERNHFEQCFLSNPSQTSSMEFNYEDVTIKWMGILMSMCTCTMKWQKLIMVVLGHLCAHVCYTGPREPPEDGEMNEMTLPSRHRIQHSSPGSLRSGTLPLGQGCSPQYWISTSEQRGTILNSVFFQTHRKQALWSLIIP